MRSLAPRGASPGQVQRPESRQSALSTPGSSRAPLERKPSAGILTTTTTPSGAREARITTRLTPAFSLQQRDQNAASAASKRATTPLMLSSPSPSPRPRHSSNTTTTTASGPRIGPRMAPEKQTSKPPLPTLARAVQRPPLTPKMATRAPPQPQPQLQTPPLAGTPLAPRNTRPESALGNEELAGFFSSNVTPRSGKRQSRVDSANSTPTGTPGLEARTVYDDANPIRKPVVTLRPPPSDAPASSSDPDAKFFYARDAQKPTAQGPPSRPAPPLNRASTFFYANGTPDVAPVLAPAQGNTFKLPSTSRPGTATSSPGYNMHQRPVSPSKLPFYSGTSKHALGSPSLSGRSPVVGSAAPFGVVPSLRRTSSEAPQSRLQTPGGIGHSPNEGLTVAERPAVARLMSEHGSYPSSAASSPPTLQTPVFGAVGGFASLLQAAEDLAEDDREDLDDGADGQDDEDSGDKEADDPLRELVASARRERKVQDLQIRNGSLEAINRSLERQLRKQTAELRRYRRLSRSGRLSLVPDDRAAECGGGGRRSRRRSTAEGLTQGMSGLSILSEEDEDDEDDDEDDEEDESSSDDPESADLSPAAVALRDARHRERDEARLRLDLSKHQQLLVDSQKMNQSLRRCLDWTEELIKEGRRALEYRVRVSEVELGGRVLAPEEMEGEDDDDDDEGSQADQSDAPQHLQVPAAWGKEPPDRGDGG